MSKIFILLILVLTIQRGQTLKCYNCKGEYWCRDEEILLEVDCNENFPQTYTFLTRHYGLSYVESSNSSEFECFSIDSTLTTIVNTENRLVYKGCVEKGFEACDLEHNSNLYINETKEHCKICYQDFCNKTGSRVNLSTIVLVFLCVILVGYE